jgi:hypothetical protein
MELLLVNAQHLKAVPGRKTDGIGGGTDPSAQPHQKPIIRGRLGLICSGIEYLLALHELSPGDDGEPLFRVEIKLIFHLNSWTLYSGNIFHRYATW